MRRKNVISALVLSIGMMCQIGSAFAAFSAPNLVGTLTAINEACQFDNLGTVTDNLCGGSGYIGIQCDLPSGVVPDETGVILSSDACVITSATFTITDDTITYCILATDVQACVSENGQQAFTATQRFGGEDHTLGSLNLQRSA